MKFARRTFAPILTGAALVALGLLSTAGPAVASHNQRAMFEEDIGLMNNPSRTIYTLRQLGVGTIRLALHWRDVAPNSDGARPAGFDATNPGAYPPGAWASYDRVIQLAAASGIEIDLLPTGPMPNWAIGPGVPAGDPDARYWRPSSGEYGQFVQAAATRYSGHYSGLPRVHFWELYNEPNWGQSLQPQANPGSSVLISPSVYRPMLDAAWNALQATGHGGDTIITGSLSPRGHDQPGFYLASEPLPFLRALYCLDSRYRPLTGGPAAAAGCGSPGSFRAAHPALFRASGIGIHPYPFNTPPTRSDNLANPNTVEFNQIPSLERTVNRLVGAYGSRARPAIFNTEYSYETNPPNASDHFVSPATAASYINWAEYISWRDPRLASYLQFLLYDPNPTQGQSIFGYGGFATGLVFYVGNRPKADYFAFRMPLFLPRTSTRHGKKLEVWGSVRPAHFVGGPQFVRIQLNGHTVKRVRITNPRGYFDVRVAFRHGGTVRLAWSFPRSGFTGGYTDPLRPGQTAFSRSVRIRIH